MANSGVHFHSHSGGETVIDLALNLQVVLLNHIVGPVRYCTHGQRPLVALLGLIVQKYAELRTGHEEKHRATPLTAPRQACQQRNLYVRQFPLISIGQRFTRTAQDFFLPSHFHQVHLALYGTQCRKIFLTGVAHSESYGGTHQLLLLDSGFKVNTAECHTRATAYAQAITPFANLGRGFSAQNEG